MTESNYPPPPPPPSMPPSSPFGSPMPPSGPMMRMPMPTQPPRPAGGRGWRIVFAVMFVLMGGFLVCSLVANCLLFGMLGLMTEKDEGPASHVAQEILIKGGSDKVAVVPAVGTVDGEMVERMRRYLDAIKADKSIKAVVVEVDSPGGTITASDEIYHMLYDLRNRDGYPLAVSMGGLAASGGYYLSMPADTIYAQPTTMTGSIGVIWPSFEVTGLMNKIGITPEIITSDQAKWKDTGSPFKKFTEEDRAYIKNLVNSAHVKFAKIVETGRAGKLKAPINEVAVGRIWTADDALKLGLIDEIAYLDKACMNLAGACGLKDPTVVRLKEKVGLIELLGVSSSAGKTKVELSPKLIYELQTPRMEYRYIDPTILSGKE